MLPALELSGALGNQSEEQVANRMQLVWRLAEPKTGATAALPPLIVAPIQALMQPVPSKAQLKHLVRELKPGNAAREAAIWHNRVFNPALPDTVQVITFKPDWASAEG